MPVNFQEIYQKIQEIGRGARERKKTLEEHRAKARDLLTDYANELDLLRSKVDEAKSIDSNIRCAYPLDESLASSYPPPESVKEATFIAADGSQINPDRHAATQFCLVNVGAIKVRLNSGKAPEVFTDSELLYGDELLPNGIPMSDGMVALRRDLSERAKLDELSKGTTGPVVTVTDGPIELWGAKGEDAKAYGEFVEKYKSVLSRLQNRDVITAGYVDKPSADLVIRLLEIVSADKDQLQNLREYHPLRGVSDRWLYGERENPLLLSGHRSAVFSIQSSSEKIYKNALSLHFFYLNVGTERHPWPVRVEIPKWVADDADMLNILHAVLVDQCHLMGSKPYPYLLHRAHEIAVVKHEEKYQVEQMLEMELRNQNDEVGEKSYKQVPKDHQGRTRYKS